MIRRAQAWRAPSSAETSAGYMRARPVAGIHNDRASRSMSMVRASERRVRNSQTAVHGPRDTTAGHTDGTGPRPTLPALRRIVRSVAGARSCAEPERRLAQHPHCVARPARGRQLVIPRLRTSTVDEHAERQPLAQPHPAPGLPSSPAVQLRLRWYRCHGSTIAHRACTYSVTGATRATTTVGEGNYAHPCRRPPLAGRRTPVHKPARASKTQWALLTGPRAVGATGSTQVPGQPVRSRLCRARRLHCRAGRFAN